MTIYLTNHWRMNKILNFILIFIYIVLGLFFCCNFESIKVLFMDIICVSFPLVVIIYIQRTTVRTLMKKVEFTKGKITLISSKNKNVTIELNKVVYYEILQLRVGVYKSERFIVISNAPFESLNKYKGLAELCKQLDKSNIQAIVPYNEETTPWLDIDDWVDQSKH